MMQFYLLVTCSPESNQAEECVIDFSCRCYDLALQLELEEGTLENIKSDNPESSQLCGPLTTQNRTLASISYTVIYMVRVGLWLG